MDEIHTTEGGTGFETPESERPPVAEPVSKRGSRGLLWALLAVVVAFLAGFGWQFYRATQLEDRLEETEQQLLVERVRVRLAQAAIAANSGQFEDARQQMSELFEVLEDSEEELPAQVASIANQILGRRDAIITGLSRSNPEYGAVLYDFLDRLRAASMAPSTAPDGTEPATPAGPEAPVDSPAAGAAGADAG